MTYTSMFNSEAVVKLFLFYLLQRLKDYQDDANKFYLKKEKETEKERNDYEELKRDLQRQIRYRSFMKKL